MRHKPSKTAKKTVNVMKQTFVIIVLAFCHKFYHKLTTKAQKIIKIFVFGAYHDIILQKKNMMDLMLKQQVQGMMLILRGQVMSAKQAKLA